MNKKEYIVYIIENKKPDEFNRDIAGKILELFSKEKLVRLPKMREPGIVSEGYGYNQALLDIKALNPSVIFKEG